VERENGSVVRFSMRICTEQLKLRHGRIAVTTGTIRFSNWVLLLRRLRHKKSNNSPYSSQRAFLFEQLVKGFRDMLRSVSGEGREIVRRNTGVLTAFWQHCTRRYKTIHLPSPVKANPPLQPQYHLVRSQFHSRASHVR
jgi:hypothetical protein